MGARTWRRVLIAVGAAACAGLTGIVWSSIPWEIGGREGRYVAPYADSRVGELVQRVVRHCTTDAGEHSGCLAVHEDGHVLAIDHIGATGIVRTRTLDRKQGAASMSSAMVPIATLVLPGDPQFGDYAKRFVQGK